jgi:hypothetical protein
LFRALFISNLDRKSAWCTLYWEQTLKRYRIENGLLKRTIVTTLPFSLPYK